ncbi:MAG TPA: glycosyltransferase family 87 protein [Candidatus Limnocylindrales bacterium]|nr:glycosyltransferase family 87 protein [Candidatus Limnocylindrales bacterium]
MGGRALLRAALPIAAILSFIAVSGLIVMAAVSSGTLGFDFQAYHQAASRVLAGERLYDPSVQQTGGFGLFYYPPPFVLTVLPLALLPVAAATWAWLAISVGMLVGGIALMPVRPTVRWLTMLLAGLSWPVAYALKLGQVGPLLLLLFAIGWRWLDRPVAVGVAGAVGAIVKIQPGLILVWAALTGRWAAAKIGIVAGLVAGILATIVLGGPSVWFDYLALLRNVSDPIATPHNFTPGAVVFQAGLPAGVATAVQAISSVLVVVVVLVAVVRTPASASYMATVIASQLLSPVLWDHYAMLLLLPVAWLLERGRWWAVLIPLVTSALTLVVTMPPVTYPVLFWLALLAVLAVGLREGRSPVPGPAGG